MGSGSLISAATKSTELTDNSDAPQLPRIVTRFVTKIARGKKLDLALANDSYIAGSIKKLLLLGAGGSGKSTIFKQMKVIYGLNYSEAEKKRIAPVIYRYVFIQYSLAAIFSAVCCMSIQQLFTHIVKDSVVFAQPIYLR